MPIQKDFSINSEIDVNNDADQYSFLLGLKEFSFLAFILFFGFTGFTYCVSKIQAPQPSHEIANTVIHDIDLVSNELSRPKLQLLTK